MNDINIEIVQPELTLEFPTNPIGSAGPGSSQDLSSVLAQGNSAGGQTITDLNELVVQIVRGLAGLQLIAGTDLTLSAANIASIIGPSIASIISNEGQVMIDGDRITIQHSGEVQFSASLLDLSGTTRMRNLPAAVNPDEPVRKQEYDAALTNKADLVGGVIPTSQISTIAITEFLGAVANQAAMLLLTGERGDWCIRQDVSMAYVLIAEDATLIANWVAIPHPQSPVLSVNGQTGVIVLSTSNIGEGSNLYWTQTRFDNAFAAKTTDGLTEGATNLYFTNARVLATTLAGLDTSTNAVITSGDSVLIAFGKLQKQITDLTAVVSGKENAISAGTTSQYWRGDKSWQTLDKTSVGLSNVDNTSDGNKPVSTAQQEALDTSSYNGRRIIEAHHEMYATANSLEWTHTVSGTGAAWSVPSGGDRTLKTFGIIRLNLGTTATGRGSIISNASVVDSLFTGLGELRYTYRFKLANLSDGTNTYTARCGFLDSNTAESTDAIYFRYTHSVNAGNWQAVTRRNNVETAVDTGIAASTTDWRVFDIIVNSDGTSVAFYIDQTLVATITTNIPGDASRGFAAGIFFLRSVGTLTFNCVDSDYMAYKLTLTSNRW